MFYVPIVVQTKFRFRKKTNTRSRRRRYNILLNHQLPYGRLSEAFIRNPVRDVRKVENEEVNKKSHRDDRGFIDFKVTEHQCPKIKTFSCQVAKPQR